MNLLRATSLYQSFRDITNTPEGPETHCEKRFIAFGVKWHLGFRSPLGPLGASCSCLCPFCAMGGSKPLQQVVLHLAQPSLWGSHVAKVTSHQQ